MNISQRLKILDQSDKTIFRLKNLKDLWSDKELNTKITAKRMVQKDLLFKLAKGYYALNQDYNFYELANLIVTPSYISFDSALFYYNINFQKRNSIDSVALYSYSKKIKEISFQYFAMKKSLFFNLEGVAIKDNLSIALPERAILDCFYFNFLPNIDNREKINTDYLKELSRFYPKSVQQKVKKIYEQKV